MSQQPTFSILHATAHRLPYAWVETWRAWSRAAVNPQDHEYVVSVHESDLEKVKLGVASIGDEEVGIPITVIAQNQRYCAVDNWNEAAKASKGKVLILGADDFFPADKWDERLLNGVIPHNFKGKPTVSDDDWRGEFIDDSEFIIHIGTGSPRDESLIVHPIMSRELYTRWGYFYYPGYESMFSDDDLTAHAKADPEVTIIDARHIVFDHRHPVLGKGSMDEGYAIMNRPEAYAQGQILFDARKRNNFKHVERRKNLTICIPGEQFSSAWLVKWTDIIFGLSQRYNIHPLYAQSSNVYLTRSALAKGVINSPIRSDYVLWIDDDNLVTPDQVQMLIDDLDSIPEADCVSGWCYIVHDIYTTSLAKVSCGWWHKDGSAINVPRSIMTSQDPAEHPLLEIDWTGFPCVLMRYETLLKAGPMPFSPMPTEHTEFGSYGEDTAFCRRAKDLGNARFFVDRRVKVPHLKLRSAEPNDLAVTEVQEDVMTLTVASDQMEKENHKMQILNGGAQ